MSSHFGPFAKRAHTTVAQAVYDSLVLNDQQGYADLIGIAQPRLTPQERWGLAWSFLKTCTADEAWEAAEAVLGIEDGAGWPLAPFDGVLEEALFWTDLASQEELEAYGLACLARLSPEKRLALWRALEGRAAA